MVLNGVQRKTAVVFFENQPDKFYLCLILSQKQNILIGTVMK
jgi:hypothetical protein